MTNINDYINGQRQLRKLEHLRTDARKQYTDIIDMFIGDTEYDEPIKSLVAELDEFASTHRDEMDNLYRQYGAHQTANGCWYTYDESGKVETAFSLVKAICEEV